MIKRKTTIETGLFQGVRRLWSSGRPIVLLSLFMQLSGGALAQPVNNRFEHLSVNDGLSNSSVNCILQDREGFMWFGTNDGLNKYDGYTFQALKPDPARPKEGFRNNRVQGLCEDRLNRLWAVTEGGLHEINKQTGAVIPHLIRARHATGWNNQLSVYEDHRGLLWLSAHSGLICYDPARHHFTLYPSPRPDVPVKCVFEDRQNRLWVATLQGLYQVDRRTGRFALVSFGASISTQPWFDAFYADDHDVLWLGVVGRGLFRMDLRRSPFRLVPYQPKEPINPFIYLNTLHRDGHGFLWVGTTQGLQRIDPATDQVTTYLPNPQALHSLSSTNAQAVYHDRAGTLWVGTDNGIDKQTINTKPFSSYQVKPGIGIVNQPENKAFALAVDSQGRVWFSDQAALYQLDNRQQLTTIPPARFGTTAGHRNYVHALLPDGPNRLWVGTWDGLYRYDLLTQRAIRYATDIPVLYLSRDATGKLWLGGEGGLAQFDPATNRYTYYRYNPSDTTTFANKYIYGLLVSRTGEVWSVVRGKGVSRLNPRTGQFTRYTAGPGRLTDNEVTTLYEDEAGRIWMGTNQGGLNCFDPTAGRFAHVTMADGLPSNCVIGITGDAAGNLWLSTYKGLCRFNPRTKAVSPYDMNDGLPSNDFMVSAVARHGRSLYFGNLNGLVRFNPDSIQGDTRPFPVYVTGFRVRDKNRPLTGRTMTLRHDENFLSFEFVALNYRQAEQNQYAYQLVGVDEHWVPSGNRRFASYPSLPPGDYTFRVKASNSDGIWSRQSATVHVVIRSPWWATWWAYGAYGFLLGVAVFGYIRFYTHRIRQRQELELNRQQAEQLRAVDELKTRFFANITHEFRTPLSLIVSPVEKLLQNPRLDPPTHRTLSLVQRSAHQLLRLINQLMDLSKLEAGRMPITLVRGRVGDFMDELLGAFRGAARQKQVGLTYTDEGPRQEQLFDADKWEKILTNLLSNALKFTEPGGRVTVTLTPAQSPATGGEIRQGEFIQITVADTGSGIAPWHLPHIFDRFYQADASHTRAHEGTGIGLALVNELIERMGGTIAVESHPGLGTTFTLRLPVEPVTDETAPPMATPPIHIGKAPVVPAPEPERTIPDGARADGSGLPRVLVVEDNADLRGFLVEELTASYRVLSAVNGEEGWQAAQAELPDVVISDLMMPRMDGYELTRLIKSHPDTDHIAVVLLTAKAAHHSRIEGFEQGADEYLTKPFHVDELKLRLRNLISYQHNLREQYQQQLARPDVPLSPESVPSPLLRRVYQLLDEHLDDALLSVDWLADQLAMSRKTLYRKVQSLTQLAPADLIRQYRLRKAADLLRTGHNATETAYAVGFKTPSHFTTVFKEFYGKTPTEFAANAVR